MKPTGVTSSSLNIPKIIPITVQFHLWLSCWYFVPKQGSGSSWNNGVRKKKRINTTAKGIPHKSRVVFYHNARAV